MKYLFVMFCFLSAFSVEGQSERDSVTVYYFMSEECRICQYYSLTQKALYEEFNDSNTSFVGLFPNGFSSVDGIKAYKEKYGIPFTLKKEFFQSKTKKFGATITPEVVVYNETQEVVIYKGRIDNSYASLGKLRRVVTQRELQTVLDDLKEKRPTAIESQPPIGCFIVLEK